MKSIAMLHDRTCPTGKGCNINKSENRVPTKAKENDIH